MKAFRDRRSTPMSFVTARGDVRIRLEDLCCRPPPTLSPVERACPERSRRVSIRAYPWPVSFRSSLPSIRCSRFGVRCSKFPRPGPAVLRVLRALRGAAVFSVAFRLTSSPDRCTRLLAAEGDVPPKHTERAHQPPECEEIDWYGVAGITAELRNYNDE